MDGEDTCCRCGSRAARLPHIMNQSIVPLRRLPAFAALEAHYQQIKSAHLRELFQRDPGRGEKFAVEAIGLYFDYAKHRVTDETMRLLIELAEQSKLREAVDAMFVGEKINITEKRAVLHVALRSG